MKGCRIRFVVGIPKSANLAFESYVLLCSIAAIPGLRESGRISSSDCGTDSTYALNLLF